MKERRILITGKADGVSLEYEGYDNIPASVIVVDLEVALAIMRQTLMERSMSRVAPAPTPLPPTLKKKGTA